MPDARDWRDQPESLKARGYAPVWSAVLMSPALSHAAKAMYALVVAACNGGARCSPGTRWLSWRSCYSARTVVRALDELERFGMIRRAKRFHENEAIVLQSLTEEQVESLRLEEGP